jgi:hypothetical protein
MLRTIEQNTTNNLDLAFDKSNVDDQQKLFLLKNKWDIHRRLFFL